MDLIVDSESEALTENLQQKLSKLEYEKVLLQEKAEQKAEPKRPFSRISRTSLDFLKNPMKLWLSEHLEDKRAVLKLVFSEPFAYSRFSGTRTPQTTSVFKTFEGFDVLKKELVRPSRLELPTPTMSN